MQRVPVWAYLGALGAAVVAIVIVGPWALLSAGAISFAAWCWTDGAMSPRVAGWIGVTTSITALAAFGLTGALLAGVAATCGALLSGPTSLIPVVRRAVASRISRAHHGDHLPVPAWRDGALVVDERWHSEHAELTPLAQRIHLADLVARLPEPDRDELVRVMAATPPGERIPVRLIGAGGGR